MNITRGTPSDAAEISALIQRLSYHFLAAPAGPETAVFFDAIGPDPMALRLAEPARVFAVARSGGGLAGVIALKDRSHVSQFFVEPHHQGQGLGRRLWDEVRRLAGVGDDSVFTVDASVNAVPVYRRLGFAECGPVTVSDGLVFVPMRRPAGCVTGHAAGERAGSGTGSRAGSR